MTYDVVNLTFLTLGRTLGVPAHAHAVTAVENIEFLERDLWLRALCVHELLPSNERWRQKVEWLIITAVDDDTDGR